MDLYDIHTHHISLDDNEALYHSSILDVSPSELEHARCTYKHRSFSCGVHPWYSENSESQFKHLSEIASDPKVIAIGETGLDKIKGPSLNIQISLFKKHIVLSEQLKKPLIIHAVKAWEELYHLRKDTKPTQPWILHGYRGNPQITEQMNNIGFMFSLGERFNVNSLEFIPIDSLFCETDESDITILEVYQQIASALYCHIEDFAKQIAKNVQRVFPTL